MKRPEKNRPWKVPPREGSFSAFRSFTLSGEGCDPVNRSRTQEVNILVQILKLQPAGRLIPPGTAPGPVRLFAGRHAPPHQTGFSAAFVIGPPVLLRVCTPTSIDFSRFEPDWGLSTKCSQVTSGRRLFYTCFSLPTTRLTCHRQNSISCTPPIHHMRGRLQRRTEGRPRGVDRREITFLGCTSQAVFRRISVVQTLWRLP